MNETKYKSLDISEEEVAAVRRYISNAHISMNALLDIDPKVICKQQSKGWVIDFSKYGIEQNTEYLTKLYSAMYKYGLQAKGYTPTVYRGTSVDEVDKLRQEKLSGRFLSTATDKEVAKRFTEYRRGAMLTMSFRDIPYIEMDKFLDETQVSESEILVSPFSEIANVQVIGDPETDGVKEYIVSVRKKEFANITDEERAKHQECIANFNFEENLARYEEMNCRLEIISSRIENMGLGKTKDDREELAYLREKQREILSALSEIRSKFTGVKTAMAAVLQDRFKTVELEIDRALEQEKIEHAEEERKRRVEAERERKAVLLKDADEVIGDIASTRRNYETRDLEEQELYAKAQELGIEAEGIASVEPEALAKFEELKQAIESIKIEIEQLEISDDMTNEEMDVKGELNKKINNLHDRLSMTTRMLMECEKTIHEQKRRNKALLSREVATKLGADITSKVRGDLLKEEQALTSKKDSFWDRLTGKSKIKAAQVENLRLRRELVERGGLNLPNSMEEMTAYVAKYREVLGEESLPESVKKLLPKAKTDVVVTYEEREVLEAARQGTSLLPVGKSKKETIAVLDGQNTTLKTRIQAAYTGETRTAIPNLEKQIKNSVEACLENAIFYAVDMPEEKRKEVMSRQITL